MPNWTPAQLKLLGTMPDRHVAKRLGCSAATVCLKRKEFGIAPFGPSPKDRHTWGNTDLGLLGFPDAEVARITGARVAEVAAKRKELGR